MKMLLALVQLAFCAIYSSNSNSNPFIPSLKRLVVIGELRYKEDFEISKIMTANLLTNYISSQPNQPYAKDDLELLKSTKELVILTSTFNPGQQGLKVLKALDLIKNDVDILQIDATAFNTAAWSDGQRNAQQKQQVINDRQCPSTKQDCER
jgi:hypothetical protein